MTHERDHRCVLNDFGECISYRAADCLCALMPPDVYRMAQRLAAAAACPTCGATQPIRAVDSKPAEKILLKDLAPELDGAD